MRLPGRVGRRPNGPIEADPRVGDTVYAQDGALGVVDRVITAENSVPAFLVVEVGKRVRRRYPVVPWSIVRTVDCTRHRVYLRGRRRRLERLSETVPMVL